MAREINKLKSLDVERVTGRGYYADGAGLYLLVGPTGAKSWIFRFRAGGRLRDMGLGPLHTISLAEARKRARICRQQRLDGIDPIEARKSARAGAQLEVARAMTFKQCAEAYIAAHQAGWRNPKHRAQWPATLEAYAYPVFGSIPVQSIDVGLVMKAIEPLWTKRPETASRVRGRIESVLDWATARGYRKGENPARWRGHLENLLPRKSKVAPVQHLAAMPYAELPDFMAQLRQQEGVAARALEFTILTAARTGEAIGARWSEIDFEARLWVIPASRMKASRSHRVPLCDRAIEILQEMQAIRHNEFVFLGERAGRPLGSVALLRAARGRSRTELTTHGFRSTFSDWCSEQTNFASEVREMALAHAVGDRVEAAYRRGDLFQKRRQLMDAWAQFAGTAPGSNVISIAAVR
jgi:integrase